MNILGFLDFTDIVSLNNFYLFSLDIRMNIISINNSTQVFYLLETESFDVWMNLTNCSFVSDIFIFSIPFAKTFPVKTKHFVQMFKINFWHLNLISINTYFEHIYRNIWNGEVFHWWSFNVREIRVEMGIVINEIKRLSDSFRREWFLGDLSNLPSGG